MTAAAIAVEEPPTRQLLSVDPNPSVSDIDQLRRKIGQEPQR